MKLNLGPAELKEIYHHFTETLSNSAIANIDADWECFKKLTDEWDRMLLPILKLSDDVSFIKKHIHLIGMGVEAVRLYFLALWLAEADFINAARVTLRSALDGLAKAVLLDRIHQKIGTKTDVETDPRGFELVVHEETKKLDEKVISERGRAGAPFPYLLYHMKDYDLDARGEKFGWDPSERNPEKLYKDLSQSVHEDVLLADSYIFTPLANKIFQLIPGARQKDEQELFSDFVSGRGRREMVEQIKVSEQLANKRNEFLTKDFRDATKIASYIIRSELRKVALC